jgi:pimeloyl-ACP methyl ester carboxylesterase
VSELRTLIFVLVGFCGVVHAQQPPATAIGQAAPSKAAIREAEILAKFPPPGRLIDIGGRRLHMLCKGSESGPTVIFEGGAFGASVWYWQAQDEVAKVARACSYDRAGIAWSDPAQLPRPLEARVDDLHELLARSGMEGPFIFAGHSMGGLIVRMLTAKYPQDVAALILFEPSNEKANGTPDAQKRVTQSAAQIGMAITALAAGMPIPQLRIPGAPPEQEIIQRESVFRAAQDDMIAMSHLSQELQTFDELGTLGDIPLLVYTRGKPDPGMDAVQTKEWHESHQWLATLSTRGELIVAEGSGHNVMADRPELYREAVARVLAIKR